MIRPAVFLTSSARYLLVFLLVALAIQWCAFSSRAGQEVGYPEETLIECRGGELKLACNRGRIATMLVSLAVDCPISNEYLPTLNKLAEKYASKGVNFIGIEPHRSQSLEQMAAHFREYAMKFPYAKDADGKVTRDLAIKVTPEIYLFDSAGKLVYRGRIDDRYRAGGAGKATSSDLERALEELLSGKPISVSTTKAVGCPILSQ